MPASSSREKNWWSAPWLCVDSTTLHPTCVLRNVCSTRAAELSPVFNSYWSVQSRGFLGEWWLWGLAYAGVGGKWWWCFVLVLRIAAASSLSAASLLVVHLLSVQPMMVACFHEYLFSWYGLGSILDFGSRVSLFCSLFLFIPDTDVQKVFWAKIMLCLPFVLMPIAF